MAFLSPNKVKLFQDRSKKILDVFNVTMSELRQVNEQIHATVEEKEEEKKQLELDIQTLENQASSNLKVLNNIEKILS